MLNLFPILLPALLCSFFVLFSPVSAGSNAVCVHGTCEPGSGQSGPPPGCQPAPQPKTKRGRTFPLEIRDDGTSTYDGTSLLPRHVGARNAAEHLRLRQIIERDISDTESASEPLVERTGLCYFPNGAYGQPISLNHPTRTFILGAGTWALKWIMTYPHIPELISFNIMAVLQSGAIFGVTNISQWGQTFVSDGISTLFIQIVDYHYTGPSQEARVWVEAV